MPPKPVPIFSQPPTVIPSRPNDSHDIATTLAFVETLDTLPGELTKTFGDLRELDAVLNSTTANVTHKLRALTATLQSINQDLELVHGNLIPRGFDRNKYEDIAQLLLEIAEELTRYKIGVEDKVRVSGQACDTLIAHQAHLQALLTNSSVLLASPSMTSIEQQIQGDAARNRRQRASPARAAVTNGFGSSYGGSDQENTCQPIRGMNGMPYDADDVTPNKRRKSGKEKNAMGMDAWDLEETLVGRRSPALGKKLVASVSTSQPYKEKKIVSKKRNRNSPAESLREHPIHHRLGKHDAIQVGPDLNEHSQTVEDRRAIGGSSHTTSSNHSIPPSTKHHQSIRSLNDTNVILGNVKGYANSAHGKIQLSDRVDSQSNARREGARPPDSQQMGVLDHDSTEADHDPTPYCYCQKQSYGEMIGCDSDDCRYEWFHLSCLNLAQPPDGTWLCPECEAREQREKRSKSKRSGTVGKVSRKRL